jgi:hypothetical protein
MYIGGKNSGYTYYVGSEQHHSRGSYLVLTSTREKDVNGFETLYGAIRLVALRQLGHFMMGSLRIGGHVVSVSGPYGSDGLPLNGDRFTVNPTARPTLYGRDPKPRQLSEEESAKLLSHFHKIDPALAALYWRDGPERSAVDS